jgi:hypothetical protein
MKIRSFTFLLSIIISLGLSAQAEKKDKFQEMMPKQGQFGVSLLIDGLIDNIQASSLENSIGENILFAKYYLSDKEVLRAGFGFQLMSQKRQTADSVGVTLVERDSSASQYILNLSIGFEKHLNASKRLDPYLFGQLDLSFLGKTNFEVEERTISSAGTATTTLDGKADGGVAIGLSFGGGMNYFLAQNFSVGAELALQIQYVNEGGTITVNQINTPINGNSNSDFLTREDQLTTTTIGVQPNALINLSYFF